MNKMLNPCSYSQMTTQSRNEFLEKFREQHPGSNLIFSENMGKGLTNPTEGKLQSIDTSGHQGRWEYLHKLEKLQRKKLDDQRQKKDQDAFEKELSECTFSPKLNKSANYGSASTSHLAQFQSSPPLSSNPCDKTENQYDVGTLLGRQEIWNQKKSMKIEGLKQNKTVKEFEECRFHPTINTPKSLKKTGLANPAKELLVDPESYDIYVSRQNRKRDNEKREMKRERSLPGSGNIWNGRVNKITKPQEFHIKTENSASDYGVGVRSLAKPLTPSKFTKVKNNYRPFSKGRTPKNPKLEQEDMFNMIYSSHRSECNSIASPSGIKFEGPIDYESAIRALHEELYAIELMKNEN